MRLDKSRHMHLQMSIYLIMCIQLSIVEKSLDYPQGYWHIQAQKRTQVFPRYRCTFWDVPCTFYSLRSNRRFPLSYHTNFNRWLCSRLGCLACKSSQSSSFPRSIPTRSTRYQLKHKLFVCIWCHNLPRTCTEGCSRQTTLLYEATFRMYKSEKLLLDNWLQNYSYQDYRHMTLMDLLPTSLF